MPDPDDQQQPDSGTDRDDPAATAEADPADPDAAPPEYTNRAARRARGKAAAQPPPAGKGPHLGGRGSVQGPRQWGNRRSG
jgi:hypothetical protein